MSDFRIDLTKLINAHSQENNSDTPDHILARYLESCLMAFDEAVRQRDKWWKLDPWKPGYEHTGLSYNDAPGTTTTPPAADADSAEEA